MTTPMPASPFLSASDGLHPLSSVAVTLGATLQLESVTAEIHETPCLHRQFTDVEANGIASASSIHSPLLLAQVDPAAFKGAGMDACQHAPPAFIHNLAELLSAGPAIALNRPAPDPDAMAGANSSAPGTDCINEIFTFARGLMRDYQPDFQALLNEIAPFPMEYLPDYRLGDDDQPLFLQGAVA